MSRYDGFEEFVAGQGRTLSRTAFFLTGDLSSAEDLLQDALVATARRWPDLRRDGNPLAYAKQVMLNHARTSWTRRRRRSEQPLMAAAEVAAADTEANVADELVLARALRQLAPRQRAVLYLRFYEDRSVESTAELLGCSPGTVKSQTSDALRRLRALAPSLLPDYADEVPE